MANVDDNLFQISNLTSTTTFYDWVNHYNQNIVGKLNNIKIFDGLSGDGVAFTLGTTASNDPVGGATVGDDLSAGVFRVSITDTISKGVTFEGDLSVNGELKFRPDKTEIPNTRFRMFGQTAGFTFGMVVRAGLTGITYARANGKAASEAIGIVAGVTFDNTDNPSTNYVEIATSGVIEGAFNRVDARQESLGEGNRTEGITFHPGCAFFLDVETAGGLTSGEPIVSGQVSKPMIIGITYDDRGSNVDNPISKVAIVNYRGQYLSTGLSGSVAGATANSNMFTVLLEGADSSHTLTEGKVVGYKPGIETGFGGWFEYTSNIADTEYAVGVVVNSFAVGSTQYIQVMGGGLVDGYNNINSEYGLQYIGVDGLLTSTPPGGVVKPMVISWKSGGDDKAFVINQQSYTPSGNAIPDGGFGGFFRSGTQGGGGGVGNYRLGNNRGATYGQAIQKNLLINGGFDIWQRDVGTKSYGATGTIYFADRWVRIDGVTSSAGSASPSGTFTDNVPTIQRKEFDKPETTVEGDPTYYLRSNHRVSGSSGPAGDHVYIVNRIENNETLAGEDVTLSFYAKCGVTGSTLGFIVSQFDGTNKTNTPIGNWVNGATYDTGLVSVGTQWQKFSIGFSVPPISTTSSDSFVDIGFDVTNTNSQLDLAQVKLERGYIPTIFEPVDLRLEYDACKRYYQRSYSLQQRTATKTMHPTGSPLPTALEIMTTKDRLNYYRFPIQMRSTPTVQFFSPDTGYTGDGYNLSANTDLRLTSGSGKDGNFRSAPAGADTIRAEFATEDGMKLFLNGGVIDFDNVYVHYTADADFNQDLT